MEYSITGGNVQVDNGSGTMIDLFTIDPTSGGITLNKQVDFETDTTQYTLEITGTVAVAQMAPGTAQVVIDFRDVNDIVPVIAAVGDKDDVNLGENQAGVEDGHFR